jgi:hypothetical protein
MPNPIEACYTELPGCCGIAVINSFGRGVDYDDSTFPEREGDNHIQGRLPIAVTTAKQKDANAALTAEGFQPLFRFVNPRSHNRLTFWYKPAAAHKLELLAPMPPINPSYVADIVRGIVFDGLASALPPLPKAKKPAKKMARKASAKRKGR